MAQKRMPFSDTYIQASGGATTETIEVVSPDHGQKIVVTQVIGYDPDNAVTSIMIREGRRGSEDEVYYEATVAAGTRVIHDTPPLHVVRGERLIVDFDGSTSGDDLIVVVRGWIEIYD